MGSSGRDVTVAVPSGATNMAYAWTGNVCDYKACAIYSADQEALPAQVWLWRKQGGPPAQERQGCGLIRVTTFI